MQDLTLRILKIREGAAVQRCHTIPHHGSYSNGAHQYGCVMLYFHLHPTPHMLTVRAILAHDLGERWVGDNPAPAKWSMDADLRIELEGLEHRALRSLGEMWELGPEEARWLKAVDMLDMWLWCHEQIALGNQYAQIICDRIDKLFNEKPENYPEQVIAFVADYYWTRTSDDIPS